MHLYEWLTIAAIIAGPIAAVSVQLWFEKRRETRKRKLAVLDGLMSNRGRLLALESVQALNRIDLVFYDDAPIRAKWAELFSEFERGRILTGDELTACYRKREDLTVEMVGLIANNLGYELPHTLIKDRRYTPQAYADDDEYTRTVREALVSLLSGQKSLSVRLAGTNPDGELVKLDDAANK